MGLHERCTHSTLVPPAFLFALADFRRFLEALSATDEKLNLKEAWVKVR